MGESQGPAKSTSMAFLYALIGNFLRATMQILIKQASRTLSPFQILYLRSACLIVISLLSIRKQGESPYIKPQKLFRYVLSRMIVMNFADITLFYCLKYLPVSTAITLYNMAPIFIFFFEAVYFKKQLKKVGLSLAILSFLGVVLIIQPAFIFGVSQGQDMNVDGFQWYVLMMLFSAAGLACNMLLVHIIAKDIPPIVNLHQSNLGYVLASGTLCSFTPHQVPFEEVSWLLLLVLAGIVLAGFFTQLFIIKANSLAKPSIVMPFGYVSVAVGFLADVLLFGTQFTTLTVVGMVLTSAGLMGNFLSEKFEKKEEGAKP